MCNIDWIEGEPSPTLNNLKIDSEKVPWGKVEKEPISRIEIDNEFGYLRIVMKISYLLHNGSVSLYKDA